MIIKIAVLSFESLSKLSQMTVGIYTPYGRCPNEAVKLPPVVTNICLTAPAFLEKITLL